MLVPEPDSTVIGRALPSVSVVIVNWNSGKLLNQCLSCLERQTVTPLQIFVVDNASSDNSVQNIKITDRVIVCPMSENLGFAKGNNRAIAQCTGDFVALLNPDAFPEPDWLEQLLKEALRYPDVAVFGSRQLCDHDHAILDGTGDIYHMSGLMLRGRYGARQQADDLVGREIFCPCAAAALYRRDALIEVGGFDEDFFCYAEDVDLGFRLRLAGNKARYVPQAIVYHVGSATTGGKHSDFAVYHGHRNLVWTYVKNMPGWLFWLMLPLHLALNAVTVLRFGISGQGAVILRAKRDALLGLPAAWRKRTDIQRRRTIPVSAIWKVLDKRLFRTHSS